MIGQVAQKRFDIQCVVVRILDPARAEFYATRGLRTVCPTSTAISVLTDAVRSCEVSRAPTERLMYILVAGGGKVGANLARALIGMGHEVTVIEQRQDRFDKLEEELEHQVQLGDATEIHVLERAGIARPPDLVLARHRRRRGQHRHLPDREGEVRRPEGDRARERPA